MRTGRPAPRAAFPPGAAPPRYHPAMRILGHGVDLVEIARIARTLDDHAERFLERCFTPDERAYAQQGGALIHERLAARFAAKEAAFKALGTGWAGGVAWTDVEVVRDLAGRPTLRLAGEFERIARERGAGVWHVSLSHTKTHALASVLCLSEPGA